MRRSMNPNVDSFCGQCAAPKEPDENDDGERIASYAF